MTAIPPDRTEGEAGHIDDHHAVNAVLTEHAADIATRALDADLVSGLAAKLDTAYANALNGTATTVRENMPRAVAAANTIFTTSGVVHAFAVPVKAGDVITSITFVNRTTALLLGSNNDGHLWFARYDSAGNLLRQTNDQGGAATWASFAVKTLNLQTTYTVPTTGYVYAAIMVNIGTGGVPVGPSLIGGATPSSTVTGVPITGQPRLTVDAGTGLTTTAPASISLATTGAMLLYCALS